MPDTLNGVALWLSLGTPTSMARRKASKAAKIEALESALRGMFKKLERRPLPDHISSIVDQLEEPAKPTLNLKKSSAG